MIKDTKVPGAETILRFYDRRGYRHAVGTGQNPAMVVIDFSNAFTRGTSEFPGGDFAAELAQTRRLLAGARENSVPVFYTTIAYADPERDSGFWGKKVPWLSCCKLGSEAVAIDPVLEPRAQEPVIVKRFPSAFFGTDSAPGASDAPHRHHRHIRMHHQRVRARNRRRCHAAQLSHDRRRRRRRRF